MSAPLQQTMSVASLIDKEANRALLQRYVLSKLAPDYPHAKAALQSAISVHLDACIAEIANVITKWDLTAENFAQANTMVFKKLVAAVAATMVHVEPDAEAQIEQRLEVRNALAQHGMPEGRTDELPDRELEALHERYMSAWRTDGL